MKIFAIGDLHFSFCERVVPGCWQNIKQHKPMDIFGFQWQNHYQKIYEQWVSIVKECDLVLVPGDISWGMTLDNAVYDLDFLSGLPGKIILVKGNHDYWWQSISKIRAFLPSKIIALQNDCFVFEDRSICSFRGWNCPGSEGFTAHDEKIYLREIERFKMSLKAVPLGQVKQLIVMTHFMPTNEFQAKNSLIELMEQFGVEDCVYGHLHNGAHKLRLPDEKWGIKFHLVSADFLDFRPKLIWQDT
ncbi:MAG: metallophosphoesterase [Bacillota bacterium]|jgi:predicted phosphohydrolase